MAELNTTDLQIFKAIDQLARGFTNAESAFAARTKDLWHLADDSGDQDYEILLKDESIKLFDESLLGMVAVDPDGFADWIRLHENHFQNNLGLSETPLFNSYLEARKIRVPQKFADAYSKAKGNNSAYDLDAANIFAKGILGTGDPTNSKMHLFGTLTNTTYVADDGDLDLTDVSEAPILAVNMNASQTQSAILSCKLATGDPKTVEVSYANSAQYVYNVVGKIDNGVSTLSKGDTEIAADDTSVYAVNQKVIIVDSVRGLAEQAVVDSISAHTSVSLKSGLLNDYAAGWIMYPCFKGITISGSSGTGVIKFYAMPDRIIALS